MHVVAGMYLYERFLSRAIDDEDESLGFGVDGGLDRDLLAQGDPHRVVLGVDGPEALQVRVLRSVVPGQQRRDERALPDARGPGEKHHRRGHEEKSHDGSLLLWFAMYKCHLDSK